MNDNMDEGLRGLNETSDRLTAAVTDMATRLQTTEMITHQLQEQQRALEKQQGTNKQQKSVNILLGCSLLLDLILSVAIGFGYVRVNHNADRINDGYVQINKSEDEIREIQERVSSEVLCPQYVLWLDLIKQSEKRPNQTDEEKQRLAEFKAVFQQGFQTLDCDSVR